MTMSNKINWISHSSFWGQVQEWSHELLGRVSSWTNRFNRYKIRSVTAVAEQTQSTEIWIIHVGSLK